MTLSKMKRNAPTARGIVLVATLLLLGAAGSAWAQHGAEPAHGHGAEAAVEAGPGADHAATAEEAHGHGGGGEIEVPHLPNLVTVLAPYLPHAVAEFLEHFENPIFSMFMSLMVTIFFVGLAGRLSVRNPSRTQMLIELFFGWLYDLFRSVLGEDARRYTPFLGTLFIFILTNNLFGMVPLGHAATSSCATTTYALGALTFLYVQGIALRKNGIVGYLHHMAGSPRTGLEWGFSVLLFPLHLLGELIKPVSLSLRLFGNIFGEDALVATMVALGAGIVYKLTGSGWVPGLPLQFPFYFLGLLSSTIQALVFTLLSTIYIALWLPHGEHAEHGEAHGH